MKSFDQFEVRLGDTMRGERATLNKSLLDVRRELNKQIDGLSKKLELMELAAIENADYDELSRRYGRSNEQISHIIRCYALYLGLNPDECVEAFWAEVGPLDVPEHHMWKIRDDRNSLVPKDQPHLMGSEPRVIGSVIVLVCLIGGLAYGAISILIELSPTLERPAFATPELVSLGYIAFATWIGFHLIRLARHVDSLLFWVLILIVPFAFSGLYWVQDPSCLRNAEHFPDYVYFSFITYTSVGYGDIAPTTETCKNIAVIQSIAGSLGLAIAAGLLLILMRRD